MKPFSIVIWLAWSGIGARVLLAPAYRLTLGESLILLLVCAPAVGILCWLRWAFRAPAPQGTSETETKAASLPAEPVSPPPAPPVARPRRDSLVKPVQVQVF